MGVEWSEDLVEALYSVLLRRKSDHGKAFHESVLERQGSAGLPLILGEVLRSPEFKRRMLDSLAEPLVREGHGFKHVVSLGTHCYTAFLLKYAGLRAASHPFDWIFSSAAMIAHCLSDDFEQFSEPANLVRVPDAEKEHGPDYNKYHNAYYRDRFGVKFIFNHHDMSDARQIAYFRRCIDRFRALMRSGDDVLLVQCAPEADDELDTFEKTCGVIDQSFRSAALLRVSVAKPRLRSVMPAVSLEAERGRHQLHRLTPTSAWRGISFDAAVDDLAVLRVVERHRLDVERRFSPWSTL